PAGTGVRSIHRTAGYGPVCPVVWEGRSCEAPPYPDCPGPDFLLGCGSAATRRPKFSRHGHIAWLRSDSGWGQEMIIDLDSWETGYADGQLGRPSRCPAGLDRFSYSGGYS